MGLKWESVLWPRQPCCAQGAEPWAAGQGLRLPPAAGAGSPLALLTLTDVLELSLVAPEVPPGHP